MDTALERAVNKVVDKAVKKAFNHLLDRLRFSDSTSEEADGKVTNQSSGSENSRAHGYPRAGFSYEIHVTCWSDLFLGAKKDHRIVCMDPDDDDQSDNERPKFRLWKCIESDGWLCFQNAGTGTFLGVSEVKRPERRFILDAKCDTIKESTKFWLGRVRETGSNTYLLQYSFDGSLYSVEIVPGDRVRSYDYETDNLLITKGKIRSGSLFEFKAPKALDESTGSNTEDQAQW